MMSISKDSLGRAMVLVVLTLSLFSMFLPQINRSSAEPFTSLGTGNWTYVEKPVLPNAVNETQIPIGGNWTYVYPLRANATYHVYFYGGWVDANASNPKTDYDIYVFNPSGELESYHTEAAGLPEHLGTTVDDPYFIPKSSGNYSFFIKNDLRESQGAKNGTFMVIEVAKPNAWNERYIEGIVNDAPLQNTSWAYEFKTTSRRVEVYLDVPDTLDMYEARLYVMAIPSKGYGILLNDAPLPWEPALYGNTDGSGFLGGYNLFSGGFRHVESLASCEYPGEDMLINYTSPYSGETLYHLVLIGEHGDGLVRFKIKTDFTSQNLIIQNPIDKTFTSSSVTILARAIDNETGIDRVQLAYTRDNWATGTTVNMSRILNSTYSAVVPGQPAGSQVKYQIAAYDRLGNKAQVDGHYGVKDSTEVNCNTLGEMTIGSEGKISVSVTPAVGNLSVKLVLTSPNGTKTEKIVSTRSDGTYELSYKPGMVGNWHVKASLAEDAVRYSSESSSTQFVVTETWIGKYLMFLILLPAGGIGSAVVFLFIRHRREQE